MPEGATLVLGSSHLVISYKGGDGNDVTLTTVSALKAWTGAVSGNWSNPQNWSPQTVPAAGETLVFPAGLTNNTVTNDMAGVVVGPVTFNGTYTLNGNELTLMGDLATDDHVNETFVCNAPLRLGASVYLGEQGASTYNGAIDVNGKTLTIQTRNTTIGSLNGSGTVVVYGEGIKITGNGSFSGAINPSGSAPVEVLGSMPGANITIPSGISAMVGTGTTGTVTSNGGKVTPGIHHVILNDYFYLTESTGVLHTKSLSLDSSSAFVEELAPGGVSDGVQVTGSVTLGGALQLSLVSGALTAGQSFTIIDNDGTDAVNGTFTGLPEGTTLAVSGQLVRISYRGGDGNDVTIAVLADTSGALTQNLSATRVGEPWTLTETVSSAFGVPTGSVSFAAGGVSLGSAPLVSGVASLTVPLSTPGSHTVIATFLGTGVFADSVSAGITHTISRGQTSALLVSDLPNARYGQTIHFKVTLGIQSPAAGQLSGSVTILAGGTVLGTVPVIGGAATFETDSLHPSLYTITATYNGDANFDGSDAPAIQQGVVKAQTLVDARSRSAVLVGQSPVITVFVNVTPGSAIVPTGMVSISEGETTLATEVLSGGGANLNLNPLPAGDHILVVNYSGDADFEASSAVVFQRVGTPALSIHGTRVVEGNRGVTDVSLVVSLSTAVAETVRVSFSTLPGTATAGEDYETASGVIDFAPGELTHTIELHILGDTVPEADESFTLLFSNAINATIDTPSVVIVIANDDPIPPRRRPSSH
ncbi:MAG TPA: Ig-like domain repeat protein [Thermoanaerobaculia bacterium]|nr:Ig-like domain repeat protein [Thermoanaerobaculia bacterium]